jgi:GTPase
MPETPRLASSTSTSSSTSATSPPSFRSGFVALIGQPNVGKSTLLNRILGTHLSIVTPRPQTTRNRVRGILTLEKRAQVVFVDTPGIHEWQEKALNRVMTETALGALADADVTLHIVDVRHVLDEQGEVAEAELGIIQQLGAARGPVILAVNKIDLLPSPAESLPIIDALSKRFTYTSIIPMSARSGEQVATLLDEVEKSLPVGPMLYPPDLLTDQAEKFFVAEMIREQVMLLTEREIPYSVAVEIEQFLEKPGEDLIHIEAVIHVERDSQKGIIIGKRGQMLRDIGQRSRQTIEKFLGKRVYLRNFVRVQPDWAQDRRSLQRFGYDAQRKQ